MKALLCPRAGRDNWLTSGRNMAKVFGFLALAAFSLAAAAQNQQGAPAVYSSPNGIIQPSSIWLDAYQFSPTDICKGIQMAINSLGTTGALGGVVVDARNYSVTSSSPTLPCSVNPFTTNANPLELVYGGTGSSAGSGGGLVLLPGATIMVSVPWLVPGNWSILGEGAGANIGTMLTANFTVPGPTGTSFATTLGSQTISATGNSWGASNIGLVLLVCVATSGCTASPTNAQVVGIVTAYSVSTHNLTLGTNAQKTTSAPNNGYIFLEPVIAWATTSPCSGGSCNGALQTSMFGSVIQDIGVSCNSVANCVPFWDQYGQERSQLKRLDITKFLGLGIGVYTSNAQNGGPFEDIQMSPSSTATSPICIEVGGTGVGGQPPMRGIYGLTCTGPGSGTGVDINTQNFSLMNSHFESLSVGIEVGAYSAATGVEIENASGGGAGISNGTIVDISGACASTCGSASTSDINVSNVYSPYQPTTQRALIDHISGNTTNEATLGFYSLGDGSGSGSASTRPVLTTSSTFGSSPNLLNMTAGTPITGVQGTGTLVQMSTLPAVTTTNLAKFDGSGNTVDSGFAPGAIPWNGLTAATGALSLANGNNATTFNQTSAVNWLWANTTTANLFTTNASPGLNIAANYYTGTASATDNWIMQSSLAAGTNGASTLTFSHTGSSGAATVTFPAIVSNSLSQTAMQSYGGTCTYTSPTPCSLTIGHLYTTPMCVVSAYGTTGSPRTALCSVSGTTVTITGSASGVYDFLVFGNPN